jgi:hypothetical protein
LKSRQIESIESHWTALTNEEREKAGKKKKCTTLIRAADTRWLSWAFVIDRLLELKNYLISIQEDETLVNHFMKPTSKIQDCRIHNQEWELLKELNKCLPLLTSFLDFLQRDTTPTFNCILSFIDALLQSLQQIEISTWVLQAQEFKETFLKSFKGRFQHFLQAGQETRFSAIAAALLDPRNNLSDSEQCFLAWSAEEGVATWNLLKQIAADQYKHKTTASSNPTTLQSTVEESKKDKKLTMEQIQLQLRHSNQPKTQPKQDDSNTTFNSSSEFDTEKAEFVKFKLTTESNVADWWNAHQDQFPMLSFLARRFLAVPVSDAGVERVWSAAGLVVTKTRNRLTETKISQMVFVKKNDWLLRLTPKQHANTSRNSTLLSNSPATTTTPNPTLGLDLNSQPFRTRK